MKRYAIPCIGILIALFACKDDGPSGPKPEIELTPPLTVFLALGNEFTDDADPGYFGYLVENGDTTDLTTSVVVTHNINSNQLGDYQAFYNLTSPGGVAADQKVRTVRVVNGK